MSTNEKSISKKVLNGTFCVALIRGINSLSALFSILILTHILTPEDFGVVAIGILVVSLLQHLFDVGIKKSLIQKERIDIEHLETGWTTEILKGFLISACLILIAPNITTFFNKPEALNYVRVLSVLPLLKSFVHINVLLYEKDLKFRKIVFMETVPMLIGISITVIMAIYTKSAWALVYGQIFSGSLRVFISYIYFPKLPTIQFQFSKFKELFVFGKWILIGGILSYVVMEGDKYFVGKFVGVTGLGLYQVGYKFTNFIIDSMKTITGRVLFPSYSIIQNDKYRIKNAILRAYSSIFFILAPATAGIVLVSYDFSHSITGKKWTGIYDVMFFLAIAAFIRSFSVCSMGSFFGYGKPQIPTYMAFVRLLVLSGTIWWLCFKFGLKGVCFSIMISNSVLAVLTTYYLYKLFSISIRDLIKHNFTTIISLLFMVLVVECFKIFSNPSSTRFILCIIFGILSYMACYMMFIKFSNIFNPISEILYAYKTNKTAFN